MKKSKEQIIKEINILLQELSSTNQTDLVSTKTKAQKPTSGCIGSIQILFDEGFFDKPIEVPAVIEKLKEMGHYHKRTTVSMNLLNLTKSRVLNRFKNKETKKWEYVIRK